MITRCLQQTVSNRLSYSGPWKQRNLSVVRLNPRRKPMDKRIYRRAEVRDFAAEYLPHSVSSVRSNQIVLIVGQGS